MYTFSGSCSSLPVPYLTGDGLLDRREGGLAATIRPRVAGVGARLGGDTLRLRGSRYDGDGVRRRLGGDLERLLHSSLSSLGTSES